MLAIRMQRTGRKGHAQFRVVVQDSHRSPSSGRVVASLGNYNPHTKDAKLDKELAQKYLSNGAQPSDRVVRVFKSQKIDLPKWVQVTEPSKKGIKNPEKLRKNQPAEEVAPAAEAQEPAAEETAPAEEVAPEETVAEDKEAKE